MPPLFSDLNNLVYTPYEIAVYITTDLEQDCYHRFDKGITHVWLKLKMSTDGVNTARDVTIGEIG